MPNITMMDLNPTRQLTFKWRKSERDLNMVKETRDQPTIGIDRCDREGLRKEAIVRWRLGLFQEARIKQQP
jgi:hypothetical protein